MSNPAAGASPTAPAQQAASSDIPSTNMSTTTTTTSTCTTATTTSSTSTSTSACHRPTASQTSIDSNDRASLQSQTTHQEYLDSLVVPSTGELERIAEIQKHRETEHRRRSREQRLSQQLSLVACDRAAAAAAISPVSSNRPTSSHAQKEETGKKERGKKGNKATQDGKQDHVGFFRGLDVFVAQSRAAVVIQRHYRGYRARREMKGFNINANTRWVHAIREARYRELTRPRARAELGLSAEQATAPARPSFDGTEASSTLTRKSESNAMRNWKKATGILKYANGDVDSDDEAGDDDDDEDDSEYDFECGSDAESRLNEQQRTAAARVRRRKDALMMGLQYFLEMIDPKHRYGANLRVYHEEWKRSDTKENFFYWLDNGEGRLVDTAACPRARLDREQVRYLSREERQYYQVKIDKEGRLCWAKNGARIDTTAKWKDSIHGIVPIDDPTPAFKPVLGDEHGQHEHHEHGEPHPRHRHFDSGSDSDYDSDSDSSVSESELEAARAAKYNIPDNDEAVGARPSSSGSGKSGGSAVAKKSHHFSPATVVDALLRKSVQKNTWIFVADTSFRLYVGLKDSGTFQHSSFLRGARISAAGLIKIRNGRLVALSPLSGHYRPPVSNFRSFMSALREEGADMRHVAVSKAYVVLVGLEAYMRTRQRGKKLLGKLHPHAHNHDHDHNEGREHGQETKPEQAEDEKTTTSTTGRLLQKLHIRSATHDDNGHVGA